MANAKALALICLAVVLSLLLLYQKASPDNLAEYYAGDDNTKAIDQGAESSQTKGRKGLPLASTRDETMPSPPFGNAPLEDAQALRPASERVPSSDTRGGVEVEAADAILTPQPPPPPVASTIEKSRKRKRRTGYWTDGDRDAAIPPRMTLLPSDDWDRFFIPSENETHGDCPPMNRTLWNFDPKDFDASAFCARWGETAISPRWRPKIYYGIMFGYEFDMLEVVLHEAYPLVDKFIFAESTLTHSLDTKPTYFHAIKQDPRYRMYMSKVSNYTFKPGQRFRSGWDIERKQRKFGLKGAFDQGIRIGDVLVGNMDLDEPFQASYLMRLKHCKIVTKDFPFYQFHFRYNLNCIQFNKISQNQEVNFHWGADSMRIKDLYKMRPKRTYENFTIANYTEEFAARDGFVSWHMSTFGGLREVLRKLQNSPHRFLSNNTEEKVLKEMQECRYGDTQMWKVKQRKSLLPKFIQQNMCIFKHKGWLPGEVTDD